MIQNYLVLGLYFFFTFISTLIAIPQTLKVFKGKKLFDAPGGRKLHKGYTPSMGGVGIFFGFIIVAITAVTETNFNGVNYLWCALLILFFTGLKDDLIPIKSIHKFIIQIISASLVVGMTNMSITSLYTMGQGIYVEQFPQWFSFFFSVFFIVAFTNAYNMIDGIDGLAGSLAVFLLSVFSVWFVANGFWTEAFLTVCMLGPIFGFLMYNWCPAKIFMGDTGSLIVGFFCAVIMILFLNKNETVMMTNGFKIPNAVGLIAALFIYPIFDVMRIFAIRLKAKRSPFSPDKLHIHLLLSRLGLKHFQIVASILSFTFVVFFIYIVLSLLGLNEILIIGILFMFCFLSSHLLKRKVKKFKKDKKMIVLPKINTTNKAG